MSTKPIYEQLINQLKEKSSTNIIWNAEKLADDILNESGYAELVGSTPIVKIAKKLGFATFKENLPNDISENIFIGGTTEDIYNHDKVIVVNQRL